ncbi:nuclear receptor ROR-alpha-like isoform X2 [Paramacrobiotus metropolitanus]|uniref:nuclear receptor ROR-alpha-like isoform X2 n=1 Tax=Paramacrobiotus metropolitanus TaxID=2943436 RepID=UPI0024465A73|nr:nuclear receptor ROR-alpha-like isoform X2 [Paramacrobiotus metropolitanus]
MELTRTEFSRWPCRICERQSTGVHYGVVSCEGCKAFYKRSVEKSVNYKCDFGDKCDVAHNSRERCKACRFRKCQSVGMSFHAVKMGRISKAERDKFHVELAKSAKHSIPACVMDEQEEHPSGHQTNPNTARQFIPSLAVAETPLGRGKFGVIRSLSDVREQITEPEKSSEIKPDDQSDLCHRTIQAVRPYKTFSSLVPDDRSTIADVMDIMNKKNLSAPFRPVRMFLQKTAGAVLHAVEVVYGDEIKLWTEFMTEALSCGRIPVQPQTTKQRMLEIIQQTLKDSIVKTGNFISMLPGFSELDVTDQKIIIIEKYLIIWLVHHARYIRNGEMYYVVGPEKIHYCRYWLDRLFAEPEYFRTVFSFAAAVNDIGLTLTETYLLGAIAVFRPDTTNARNKEAMAFSHAFYVDVVFYLVGKRLSGGERTTAFSKLERLIDTFPVIHKLAVNYVNAWELTNYPIKTSTGISFRVLLNRE